MKKKDFSSRLNQDLRKHEEKHGNDALKDILADAKFYGEKDYAEYIEKQIKKKKQ